MAFYYKDMELQVSLLILMVSSEGICGHGWWMEKLPFSVQAGEKKIPLKCEQDPDKRCVTECPFKRPQPWKTVLYAELVFEKDICKDKRTFEKNKGRAKCRSAFEDCFSEFPLEYYTIPPVLTISMILDISLPESGKVRIFQWGNLMMDMERIPNRERGKLIFNNLYCIKDMHTLGKAFYILITVKHVQGNITIDKIFVDDEEQKMSEYDRTEPVTCKHNTMSNVIHFGYKPPEEDRKTHKYLPLAGTIKSFGIFKNEMNTSDRYIEKHFFLNLQDNVPSPECICQQGYTDGRNQCFSGLDRLTGSPSNTTKDTYFVPVQAVNDGVKNDTYGFWQVNQGELTIKFEKQSIIRKLEIYMSEEQEIKVSFVTRGQFICLTCAGGLTENSSQFKSALVIENNQDLSFKKFIWTWEDTTSSLVTKSLHISFDHIMNVAEGNYLDGNQIHEISLYGMPLDEMQKTNNCICFPGNFQGKGKCDECGQCVCRAGNQILAGKMCEPYITHLKPTHAYISGGTTITIYGGLLLPFSFNTTAEVQIGMHSQCNVTNITDADLTCVVQYSYKPETKHGETTVSVFIKEKHIPYPVKNKVFLNLTADPEIKNVTPHEITSWSHASITIEGTNLGYVENIKLTMNCRRPRTNLWKGVCLLAKDDLITCNGTIDETPIPKDVKTITIDLGLELDDIPAYRNITAALPYLGEFKVLLKPEITYVGEFSEQEHTVILQIMINYNPNEIVFLKQVEGCVIKFPMNAISEKETGDRTGLGAPTIACSIVLPVCLLLVILILLWKRREKKKAKMVKEILLQKLYQGVQISESDRLLDTLRDDLRHILNRHMIDRSRLHIKKEIGKGRYGKVYLGFLNLLHGEQIVAVKTLRSDHRVSARELSEFLEEATVMRDFDHQNVLTLLGIVVDEDRMFIVLPYMKNGDLRTHVTRKLYNFKRFTGYVCDVARGMEYLSEQEFIHSDLSARSCMVDATERVLIADLGLVRDLVEADQRCNQRNINLQPWIALECLQGCKFTTQSDVWSFGVLMWEVYTRGLVPYEGYSDGQLRHFLKTGGRLKRPAGCPQTVFELQLECWDRCPDHRPTFSDIVSFLEELLDSYGGFPNPTDSLASLNANFFQENVNRASLDLTRFSFFSQSSSEDSSEEDIKKVPEEPEVSPGSGKEAEKAPVEHQGKEDKTVDKASVKKSKEIVPKEKESKGMAKVAIENESKEKQAEKPKIPPRPKRAAAPSRAPEIARETSVKHPVKKNAVDKSSVKEPKEIILKEEKGRTTLEVAVQNEFNEKQAEKSKIILRSAKKIAAPLGAPGKAKEAPVKHPMKENTGDKSSVKEVKDIATKEKEGKATLEASDGNESIEKQAETAKIIPSRTKKADTDLSGIPMLHPVKDYTVDKPSVMEQREIFTKVEETKAPAEVSVENEAKMIPGEKPKIIPRRSKKSAAPPGTQGEASKTAQKKEQKVGKVALDGPANSGVKLADVV